jgi:hypothetical protein
MTFEEVSDGNHHFPLTLNPIIALHSRWEAIARSHLQESIGFAADGQDWCYHVRSEWLEIALGREGAALLRPVLDMPCPTAENAKASCPPEGGRDKFSAFDYRCSAAVEFDRAARGVVFAAEAGNIRPLKQVSRLQIASSFRECNKERERRKVPLAQSVRNLISM